MRKHAYLIIAHDNFYILERLLLLLDDYRNDIYLHIDKKVEDFDYKKFEGIILKSNITFVEPTTVYWGGYSQVDSELRLFEAAYKHKYSYFHLISGVDLPIKTQDYIHDFFENNNGKEFIGIERIGGNDIFSENVKNRIKKYHFFNDIINMRDSRILYKLICKVNSIILRFQDLLGVNRYKEEIFFGPNWVSLTEKCVKIILKQKNEIIKNYKFTCCSDEIFIQNIIANDEELFKSVYDRDNTYNSCQRLVDWNRGNPYIFKSDSFEELINSNKIFARKFNEDVDKEIVDRIFEYIYNKQKNI